MSIEKMFRKRESDVAQATLVDGLHQAAALAALSLLYTAHRAVMNTGFTLRRDGLSTDAIIVLTVGALTSIWTLTVIIGSLFLDDKPCRESFELCAARMAYCPWLLQILFFFWLFAYIDELRILKSIRQSASSASKEPDHLVDIKDEHIDEESGVSHHPAFEWAHPLSYWHSLHWPGPWHIWCMDCSQGLVNWRGSVRPIFRYLLYCTLAGVILTFSAFALIQKVYTLGLLNMVGVVLFIADAAGTNSYATAPHRYARDCLRVVLHTRHKRGTTYILPTRNRGLDAVWGPKIENENRSLDAAVRKWQDDGGYEKGKLINMDGVLAAFNTASILEQTDINLLAAWLFQPKENPSMCQIACKRATNIHLIAFSVMSTLWHAEYLVFMGVDGLPEDLKRLVGKLRSTRGTGLDIKNDSEENTQIGSKDGIEGYQDAVRYVYTLFGIEESKIDQQALIPDSPLPKKSVVFDDIPGDITAYTAQLWHKCMDEQESTFAAFCAFTSYWHADIGDDVKRGRHQFPFRALDQHGDMVSWHVIWRQAWYQAVIAQLRSMSPIISSAFLAGVFQSGNQ